MKRLIDGHFRLEPKDFEILEFIHEQSMGANLHFKLLCRDQSWRLRVRELLNLRFIERKHWKEQAIDYFILAYKGFKALKRRIYRAHLMPIYRVSQGLNQVIGERLEAGLIRIAFKQLGLNDWTSERVLKIRDKKIYPVPTGEVKKGDRKIAIHFEPIRTKPVTAYESLLQDYLKSYDQIWMVVDWNVPDFLAKAKDEFKSQSSNVWLIHFHDLIEKSAQARAYGFKDENRLLADLVNGARQW